MRWLDSDEISHAVYENWTKENGYFYCGTLRVKQYPCYYCYWVLIFPCQQVLSALGINVILQKSVVTPHQDYYCDHYKIMVGVRSKETVKLCQANYNSLLICEISVPRQPFE